METLKWEGRISLIKGIEKHIGIEPIQNEGDRLLVEDLMNGVITTYQEAANKYTHGNTTQVIRKIDKILNQYLKFLFDLDVYHNEAQRMVASAGIGWEGTKKMLHLGYRKGAIENAELIYEMAISAHSFDIASSVSAILSHHYGHLTDEDELCDSWYEKFELCYDQYYWVQEARHNFSKIMRTIRRGGENIKTANKLKPLLKRLEKYKDDAQSYMYWFCYYQANAIVSEVKGDYKAQIEIAKLGHEYFDDLELDHRGLIIEIFSLLRYRYSDQEQYSKVFVLIENLRTARLHSTESEILRFETMIDELIGG